MIAKPNVGEWQAMVGIVIVIPHMDAVDTANMGTCIKISTAETALTRERGANPALARAISANAVTIAVIKLGIEAAAISAELAIVSASRAIATHVAAPPA